jgi:hypothetical protein
LIEGKTFPVIAVIGDVDDLKTSDDNFGYTATYNLLRKTAEVLNPHLGVPRLWLVLAAMKSLLINPVQMKRQRLIFWSVYG